MKICLINPPQILKKQYGKPYVFQPLGILYIAAVLEKKYEVEVIDATAEGWRNATEIGDTYYLGLSPDVLKKRIKESKPDVVGISVTFSVNAGSAFKVASLVKSIDKKIIVVMGGPHVTVRSMETLLFPDVDFVVIGEGEQTMQELMEKIENGSINNADNLSAIKGIGYKKSDKPVINPRRSLIQNLDSLPFPARHLIPMEEYFKSMAAKKGSRMIYTFNEGWASLFTSRGCPYNCNFCTINLTMGRQFRPRSPENVFAEIKQLYERYGIRHINFEDDNLTMDKKRAEQIFDLIIKNKINITWSTPNGIRVENIDENLVQKMKQSGCKRVFVAPESGVQRVVSKIIGKSLDLKKIKQAVRLFKKNGIIVDGSFVIGLIGETKLDIWRTIIFALKLKRLGMNKAGIHIATPYFGTRFYDEAVQKGYLKKEPDIEALTPKEPLFSTPEWSAKELKRLHKIANWLVNSSLNDKIISVLPHHTHSFFVFLKRKFNFLRKII